jgi:hypothetical protein
MNCAAVDVFERELICRVQSVRAQVVIEQPRGFWGFLSRASGLPS